MKLAGNKSSREHWLLLFKVFISAGLLVWLAQRVPLAEAFAILPQARLEYVFLAVLLLGLSLLVSSWRWWFIAAGGLSFAGCLKYTWVAVLWALVLPGALSADVAKGVAMKTTSYEGNDTKSLAMSILMDRVAGLGVLLVVGLILVKYTVYWQSELADWSLVMASVIFIALLLTPRLLLRKLALSRWLLVIVMSFGITLINISFYWMCAISMGGQHSWMQMGVYTVLLNLAMLLPISIGGIGVREAISVHLLTYSAGAAGSIAFSWMVLLITILHGIVGLCLQWMAARIT